MVTKKQFLEQNRNKNYVESPPMDTPNSHYNRAWNTLREFFPETYGLLQPNIDLEGSWPKSKKQWLAIYVALNEVLTIGERNDWLSKHVNRLGQLRWLIHRGGK